MTGGHHVLERMASRSREMFGYVLSVWTHVGHLANTMQTGFSAESLDLPRHGRRSFTHTAFSWTAPSLREEKTSTAV